MHRIEETIERGMCIGCGACAIASRGTISLGLDPIIRIYQANLNDADEQIRRKASRVCPFSDESPNENELSVPQGFRGMRYHSEIGWHIRALAGRVADDSYLTNSSSGGMASWFTASLVRQGLVDFVLSVGRGGNNDGRELFSYGVNGDPTETATRKSHYYASTLHEVLRTVHEIPGRYAIVGVPCYIKAARALTREDRVLSERLVAFVGLVCGHMKSQAFAESMAWQVGVPPDVLQEVDFRIKVPGRPSSEYDFGARAATWEPWKSAPTRSLIGGNWGHSAFQPEACNFCDDVVGETADISFGDAWLPQFESDSRGTNLVITRNSRFDELISEGLANGEIHIVPLEADAAARSQAGGFRHRREGLAVRLADDVGRGLSVPTKRVSPEASMVTPRRMELIRQRRRMAALSHEAHYLALQRQDLRAYLAIMKREIRKYNRLEARHGTRAIRMARRIVGRALSTGLRSKLRTKLQGLIGRI